MIGRLWYPQLDVFDAARRSLLLVRHWDNLRVPLEMLSIASFYLANPPLLYRTSMPADVRKKFSALKVVRPEKAFLVFPPSVVLFSKMEPVQAEAVRAMVAKGVMDDESFRNGLVQLSESQLVVSADTASSTFGVPEGELLRFLTSDFIVPDRDSLKEIHQRTGLRKLQ